MLIGFPVGNIISPYIINIFGIWFCFLILALMNVYTIIAVINLEGILSNAILVFYYGI